MIKSFEDTQCAAAYSTIEGTLRKDAIHPSKIENTPSYKDTLINISDKKHKLLTLSRP